MSLADLGSLRVSVSLDSARFDQGVKAMNARMAALRSEYKAMGDGTKTWDKSTAGLAAKQRMLTGLIEAQASKVRSLRTAYNEAAMAHGANSTQADRAAARLNNQIAQHNKLRSELRQTTQEYARATNPLMNYGKQMSAMGESVSNVGDKMVSAGLTSLMFTAPLIGIGKNIMTTAMEFEYSMAKVSAVANLTGSEYARLEERSRALGASTMFSASEVSSAMLYLSMSGQKANDIYANTPHVMNLAQASFMDLGLAADITTNIMTPFGLVAQDTARVVDILAAAASNANTDVPMLGEAMKYLAPMASNLGWTVEEAAAAVMIFANNGIQGSIAGQAFATSLGRLAEPTDRAKEYMDKLGISFFDAEGNMKTLTEIVPHLQDKMKGLTNQEKTAAITALFGAEAQKHWLSLINDSSGDLSKFTALLENSNGEAQRMADTMGDTFYGKIKALQSAFEELKIAIGYQLIDQFSSLVKSSTEFLTNIQKYAPGLAKFLAWATAAGVSLTALSLIFGSFLKMGGGVMSIMGNVSQRSAEAMLAAANKRAEQAEERAQQAREREARNVARARMSAEENRIRVSEQTIKGYARDRAELNRGLNQQAFHAANNAKMLANTMERMRINPRAVAQLRAMDASFKNIAKSGATTSEGAYRAMANLNSVAEKLKQTQQGLVRRTISQEHALGAVLNAQRRVNQAVAEGYKKAVLASRVPQQGAPVPQTPIKAVSFKGTLPEMRTETVKAAQAAMTKFNSQLRLTQSNAGSATGALNSTTASTERLTGAVNRNTIAHTANQRSRVGTMRATQAQIQANATLASSQASVVRTTTQSTTAANRMAQSAGAIGTSFIKGLGPMLMFTAQAALITAAITAAGAALGWATTKLVKFYSVEQKKKNDPQKYANEQLQAAQKETQAAKSRYEAAVNLEKTAQTYDSYVKNMKGSTEDLANALGILEELSNPDLSTAEVEAYEKQLDALLGKLGLTRDDLIKIKGANAELIEQYPELATFHGDWGVLLADTSGALREVIREQRVLAGIEYQNKQIKQQEEVNKFLKKAPELIADYRKETEKLTQAEIQQQKVNKQMDKVIQAKKEQQALRETTEARKKQMDEITDKESERYKKLQAEQEKELARIKEINQEYGASYSTEGDQKAIERAEEIKRRKAEEVASQREIVAEKLKELAVGKDLVRQMTTESVAQARKVASQVEINFEAEKGVQQFRDRAAAIDEEIAKLEQIKQANGGLTEEQQKQLDNLLVQKDTLTDYLDIMDLLGEIFGEEFLLTFMTDPEAQAELEAFFAELEEGKEANVELKIKAESKAEAEEYLNSLEETPVEVDVEADLEQAETDVNSFVESEKAGTITFNEDGSLQVLESRVEAPAQKVVSVDDNGTIEVINAEGRSEVIKPISAFDKDGKLVDYNTQAGKDASKYITAYDAGGKLRTYILDASKTEIKSINFREGSNSIASVLAPLRNPISVAVDFFTRKKATNNYRGTASHPGGWSYVGEMGRELGFIPGEGWQMLGQHGQELRDLPRGSKVIPNGLTEQIMKGKRKIPGYATGVGLEGVINVEVPREGRENVYNINLNYSGSASKEDAMTMAQIVMDEIEKKERRNRRARGEKKFV